MAHRYPMQPKWYLTYLAIACIVNVIAGIVVWKWKKWGLYLFAVNIAVVMIFEFIYAPLWMGCIDCLNLVLVFVLVIPSWKQMD